jgi:tRNA-binding protein
MKEITWDEFTQVELRVGTVVEVSEFPEARKPAWKLQIDFGEEIGLRKSSAQITDLYDAEDLLGRQVVAVVNFPKKQIGPIMSECLVTGFYREDGAVVLIMPERPGGKVTICAMRPPARVPSSAVKLCPASA